MPCDNIVYMNAGCRDTACEVLAAVEPLGRGMGEPMDAGIIAQFALATLMPALVSACLTALRKGRAADLGYWPWQILCGIVFGAVAIFGTEFGIATHDATMNVRDAAPIVSGLYFGGPSGIIAGLIGGIERWFSVLWGRGMYTRVACSVATMNTTRKASLARASIPRKMHKKGQSLFMKFRPLIGHHRGNRGHNARRIR